MTYPRLTTLILTEGGKTAFRAEKQAKMVLPVVNT